MKILIFFLYLNMFFGKIDKIFRIKGDFVNQGGKIMFALNPEKLKKD